MAVRIVEMGNDVVIVNGRHGYFIVNRNDRFIGQSLIKYGEYVEAEWNMLSQYCSADGVVIDIGANIGAHTVPMARLVGAGGTVLAVEPNPAVFNQLCGNLAVNGIYNVRALNIALGEKREIFNIPSIDYGSKGNFGALSLPQWRETQGGTPVLAFPLDEIVSLHRVDLIKIDVEGMEASVIRGAKRIIASNRPVMYVENDRVERSMELIELLHDIKYEMWWHMPHSFNQKNWFSSGIDGYDHCVSLNMLCVPVEKSVEYPVNGLEKVRNSEDHPWRR